MSWPNSLVRRPPWLHACSVKNTILSLWFDELFKINYLVHHVHKVLRGRKVVAWLRLDSVGASRLAGRGVRGARGAGARGPGVL